MVPGENKSNTYENFGGTNKEYYGIFESGLGSGLVLTEPESRSFCIRLTSTIKAFVFVKDRVINLCAPTSTRRTFFVVQARFSRKLNKQQQSWLHLHGPRSSGVSRRTNL